MKNARSFISWNSKPKKQSLPFYENQTQITVQFCFALRFKKDIRKIKCGELGLKVNIFKIKSPDGRMAIL